MRYPKIPGPMGDEMVPLYSTDVLYLNALKRVLDRDGRATVRSVAAEADRGHSATYARLKHLRKLGMVNWVDDRAGTLHLTVDRVDA